MTTAFPAVIDTNSIADFEALNYSRDEIDYSIASRVHLDDERLVSVDRLRFISSPGFPMWDFSYAYGTIVETDEQGQQATRRVTINPGSIYQLPKRTFWSALRKALAEENLDEKRARKLGLFKNEVVSLFQ